MEYGMNITPGGVKLRPASEKSLSLEYRGIEYELLPGVYPPSEDTFLLLDAAVGEVSRGERVLEVCCGTGLVALSIKSKARWVIASDISERACRNASLNGIEAFRSDILDAVRGPFDLLLCNPPYLPDEEDVNTRGEPSTYLDGGEDGLEVTRRLVEQAPPVLGRGGRLLFVASSLQGWDKVDDMLLKADWEFSVVGKTRALFEELRVYRCMH